MDTNKLVTTSHFVVVILYTILSTLVFIILDSQKEPLAYQILLTLWTFMGGIADLFISCMFWLIMEEHETPEFLRHGDYVYTVVDIVK